MCKQLLLCVGLVAAIVLTACGAEAVGSPLPGGNYRITLPVDTDHASLAWLFLTVSQDGSAIESIRLFLKDVECEAFRAKQSDYYHVIRVPIRNGRFDFEEPGVGEIQGYFTADGGAAGTIKLSFNVEDGGALTEFMILKRDVPCDLGSMDWTADAP